MARESTRLRCAAVTGAQTTLDPQQMKEWTPNSRYGSHAFGIFKQVNGQDRPDFAAFLAQRENGADLIGGEPFRSRAGSVLASNGPIHDLMLEVITSFNQRSRAPNRTQ